MIDVVIQTGALILLGVLWRVRSPHGLDGSTLRHSLTTLVYVLLLPALALVVLWKAPLASEALIVAGLAFAGLAVGYGSAWLWYRFSSLSRRKVGALLLAATFPNATYMGLPVLEVTLGPWARSIAIQYDLFACTPVLLSVGVLVAARYGDVTEAVHPLRMLMRVPPLWGALIGVMLNLGGVPLPGLLEGLLELLGSAVVPLMLFALGLGLSWTGSGKRMLGQVWPVLVIQLLLTPAVIWWVSGTIVMDEGVRAGIVLEAAMPSMVLGIVLCDRYRLDVGLYAMAVTLSTALSLISLPFWFGMTGA